MGLTTVTAATQEPISLSEIKDHLRLTSTSEDGLLAGFILAAREWVEGQTHTLCVTQTLDYTIDDGWPYIETNGLCRQRIELPVRPVASVTSVQYVDSNGATQTLATDQYVVRTDGPVPFIAPAYAVIWPTVRIQPAAITVRFVAGYAASDVPQSLIQAIRYLTAHMYANRDIVSMQQFTELPFALEAMVSPHRYSRFS